MAKLDHIMYATPDLDQGIAEIEELTGVTPAIGGTHPGMGTRNALLSLGTDQYLEIIAPDPQQEIAGTLGELLVQHGGSGIRSWAVATDDLSGVRDITDKLGIESQPIIDMNRTTPEGVRLDWQLLLLTGSPMLPFFIDWKNSPHPALNTPSGCTLSGFSVSVADDAKFKSLLEALNIDVTFTAEEGGFNARLQTPSGAVELNNW